MYAQKLSFDYAHTLHTVRIVHNAHSVHRSRVQKGQSCDCINFVRATDQACGTGGMLSTSYNFIKRYNPSVDVRLFGQEINPESYAICLAEMMIKGQNAENICYQDTMKADRFKGTKMRFVIENPPFGTPWGGKDAAESVEQAQLMMNIQKASTVAGVRAFLALAICRCCSYSLQ